MQTKRPIPKSSENEGVFSQYVSEMPGHQNAIDAIPGWISAFPPEFALSAGTMKAYSDPRIQWAIALFGELHGRHVLELGPLEGSHSFMLDNAGAFVDAIEANKFAFQRCLVAKEILKMKNVSFFLGDFVKWLQSNEKAYDLVLACGVLYHMPRPLELLELIAKRTNAVYLWTHYISEEESSEVDTDGAIVESPFEIERFRGIAVRSRSRRYHSAERDPAFCGGMRDAHRWLCGDDIIAVLRALGFSTIELNHQEPAHQNGPAMSIFARKD